MHSFSSLTTFCCILQQPISVLLSVFKYVPAVRKHPFCPPPHKSSISIISSAPQAKSTSSTFSTPHHHHRLFYFWVHISLKMISPWGLIAKGKYIFFFWVKSTTQYEHFLKSNNSRIQSRDQTWRCRGRVDWRQGLRNALSTRIARWSVYFCSRESGYFRFMCNRAT